MEPRPARRRSRHAGGARRGRAAGRGGAARALGPQPLRGAGHERRAERAGRARPLRAFAGPFVLAGAGDACRRGRAFAAARPPGVARREEPLRALPLAAFAVRLPAVAVRSRTASPALHRALGVPWAAMRSADARAAARSPELRLPICRSAQLTAFFT